MKILIVEDDFVLAEEILRLCKRWGFEGEYLEDFSDVDKQCESSHCDLVLMDINLPFYDGFYWCQKIRSVSKVPILFLSSRDQNADKVMAMVSGGDDYVEKPFDAELLLVKIRSLLRRSYEYTQSDREYLESGLVYDRGQGILLYKNQPIEMTKSENRIMGILADYKGQVVDRETLMQGLWNTDEYVTDASLTVLVSKFVLRQEEVPVFIPEKGKGIICNEEIFKRKMGGTDYRSGICGLFEYIPDTALCHVSL